MTQARMLLVALTSLTALVAGCDASDRAPTPTPTTAAPTRSSDSPTSELDITAGKTAGQALTLMRKAVAAEAFVNVDGTERGEGMTQELHLSYAGETAAGGTFVLGDGEVTLLRHGDETWFKANDAFWRDRTGDRAGDIIEVIDGRWVATAGLEDFAGLESPTQFSFVTDSLLKAAGKLTLGEESEVDGHPCRVLRTADSEICLSTEDARPLQIRSYDGFTEIFLTYSERPIAPAPAASEIVDPRQLST